MAADDDVPDAVDDAAELEGGRLGGHRLRVVQFGVRHQVPGVPHCRRHTLVSTVARSGGRPPHLQISEVEKTDTGGLLHS